MMLRTWDGLRWFITYYDGDTQLGKRNDCFLVYLYTTDRDTWDAEAASTPSRGMTHGCGTSSSPTFRMI